jgi:hypothetical protein
MTKFKVKAKVGDKQIEIEGEFDQYEFIVAQVNYFLENGKFLENEKTKGK